MNKSLKNVTFDVTKGNYKIGCKADGLDLHKVYELKEIINETPMDINKINHFMVGLTKDDLDRYTAAVCFMMCEKKSINKHIAEAKKVTQKAIDDIGVWSKWVKGTGNLKAVVIVCAAIMMWLSNLVGNTDYTVGLAKAFGVVYSSLFVWIGFLRLAMRGSKDRANKKIKMANNLRAEFMKRYQLTSLKD